MIDWKPISEVTPHVGMVLLAQFDHDSDAYVEDEGTGRLTPYATNAEGGEYLSGKGIALVRWSDEYHDAGNPMEGEPAYTLPAWWTELNSDGGVFVYPVMYAANIVLEDVL